LELELRCKENMESYKCSRLFTCTWRTCKKVTIA